MAIVLRRDGEEAEAEEVKAAFNSRMAMQGCL